MIQFDTLLTWILHLALSASFQIWTVAILVYIAFEDCDFLVEAYSFERFYTKKIC